MNKKILILFLLCYGSIGLSIAQLPQLSAREVKQGWILLFDGKTTNGWLTPNSKPVPAGWEIKDGCIKTVKGGKGGDIITVKEYADFELSVDFNIAPGCNSGIKYFYTKYPTGGNLGMEYQVIDDKLGEDIHKENHLCGSLYDVLPVTGKKIVKAPGEWNTIHIVSRGKHVEHWLNGVKILEYTRGDKAFTDAVALSKFNKTVPAFGMVEKGHLLLQDHGGVATFRNIKIKLL